MLSADRMEEFQSEEEEPWYDQQDLEQGKAGDTASCQGWKPRGEEKNETNGEGENPE